MTDHFNYYSKSNDHPFRKTTLRRTLEKDNEERKYRQSIIPKLKSRTKYELMYEAFYVANMFYYMNETDKYAKDSVFYIISTSWFNRWKRYVNFDYYMNNTEKFLQINTMSQTDRSNTNFISTLDPQVKSELDKFFDNFFLTNNSDNYPGVVSNKDLLYDKASYYVNFDKPKSSINYNIIDSLENGNDYFIISADIWKLFKAVYGGKEIKRYKVNIHDKNTNNGHDYEYSREKCESKPSLSQKFILKPNELLIESKLKVINLIITKYINSKSIKVEKPKFIFISYTASLYDLKKHLIEMFFFLKNIDKKDIRLWVLDPKFTYDSFDIFINEKIKEDSRILFPGFSLNLFEDQVELGDIDDMLNNKMVVLEYIEYQQPNFIFKSQYLNDFSKEFQTDIKLVSKGKKKMITNPNMIYDKISFNHNNSHRGDKANLFSIKKFFRDKYQLNYLNELESNVILKKIIENEFTSSVEFYREIEILRDNMDLIFDKNELLVKFSLAYSNSLNRITTGNSTMELMKKKEKTMKTVSKQDFIMKKRERAKIMEQLNMSERSPKEKDKDKESIKDKDKHEAEEKLIMKLEDNNIDIHEEEEEEVKCSYCTKVIEGEIVKCSKCLKVKYCNSICLNKDLRFHNKTCLIK